MLPRQVDVRDVARAHVLAAEVLFHVCKPRTIMKYRGGHLNQNNLENQLSESLSVVKHLAPCDGGSLLALAELMAWESLWPWPKSIDILMCMQVCRSSWISIAAGRVSQHFLQQRKWAYLRLQSMCWQVATAKGRFIVSHESTVSTRFLSDILTEHFPQYRFPAGEDTPSLRILDNSKVCPATISY